MKALKSWKFVSTGKFLTNIAKSDGVMLIASISIIFLLVNFLKIAIAAMKANENKDMIIPCHIGSLSLCREDSEGQLEGFESSDSEFL